MSEDAVTDLTRGVYRRLYSGFIKGQRINKLSLQAEAWFWRVFAIADDFGNCEAEPELLRASTAGRRKVTVKQVERWLNEMESVGLVNFYHNKAERYLHIYKFEETQPAGKNGKRLKRFPLPGESDGIQVNPDSSSASHSHSDNHNDNHISLAEQARRVFGFWREHMKHPKAALDEKREKAIKARLRDGYSVDDLTLAVQGCKLTPHNMGKNDRGQVYDDIELICRDAAHVDRFIATASANGNSNSRQVPKSETIHDRLLREACEDCHGTGTKVIRGKGAIRCEHANAVITASGDSVTCTPQDSEARVS